MVIQHGNDESLRELALFAGAGGGILGGKLLGWRTVCAVERDAYAAQILAQRQNDGVLEPFPIWSDVCSFDGKPWRGVVDVISGGFPCQDISAAGKGAGIEGSRSGMWKEMARIIGEVRPKYAFVENSPMLTTRGLGVVLADLASMGFDAEWGVLSAADVGANHQRERIWVLGYSYDNGQASAKVRTSINERSNDSKARQKQASKFTGPSEQYAKLAYTISNGWNERGNDDGKHDGTISYSNGEFQENMAYPSSQRQQRQGESNQQLRKTQDRNWQANIIKSIGERSQWTTEPDLGRVVNGVAFRVDRLKAIGNGQVPLCAATAFKLLKGRLEE